MRFTSARACFHKLATTFTAEYKEHCALASVLLWSVFVCVSSGVYVVFGITLLNAWVIFAATIAGAWYLFRHKNFQPLPTASCSSRVVFILAVILDVVLACLVWHGRTDAALRSPWELVHPYFFGIYGSAIALLTYGFYTQRAQSHVAWAALYMHTALTYGIAALAFRYGFGYDPIIHQTAENYVALHGKIYPLQPFYIGQYATVTIAHFITHTPVWLVDRLYVPLLAALSLPPIAYSGFTRGWRVPAERAALATIFLSILPIAEFTFTVPHNITILYALWWVLLLPYATQSRYGKITLCALSCAAICTHPLLGVPLGIATLYALFKPTLTRSVTASFAIGFGLLAMLGLYRVQHGQHFVTTYNPFTNRDNLFSVVRFGYDLNHLAWQTQLVYIAMYALPWLILLCGVGILIKNKHPERHILFALLGGLVLSICLISTLIYLPGVVDAAQNEFVLRIRYALPIFVLPVVCAMLVQTAGHKRWVLPICVALIPLSFYLTYPRVDALSRAGWNSSASDIAAAHTIEQVAGTTRYAVIAPDIQSIIGLREIGFDRTITLDDGTRMFPYAISVDEPVYPYFINAFYEQIDPVIIQSLIELVHGPVFVMIPDTWYRSQEMFQEARAAHPVQTYRLPETTIFEFR